LAKKPTKTGSASLLAPEHGEEALEANEQIYTTAELTQLLRHEGHSIQAASRARQSQLRTTHTY